MCYRARFKKFSSRLAYLEFRGRTLLYFRGRKLFHEDNHQQGNDSLRDSARLPAGAGKTMLAVDFVRRHEGCAAWYKVDAPDMSLPVFLEYLVASVARVRPGFGRQTQGCHARAFRSGETGAKDEFDIAALAEAYVYDLERQAEPLVLVIDDLHLIY